MALADLTSSEAVLRAIREYDALGRDAFLKKYGFGKSRRHYLVHDGRSYDSKAIAGVAHGYQFPTQGPLTAYDFKSGEKTVCPKLQKLGFEVRSVGA